MRIVIDGRNYAVADGLAVTVEGTGSEVQVFGLLDGVPVSTRVEGKAEFARTVPNGLSVADAVMYGWLEPVEGST